MSYVSKPLNIPKELRADIETALIERVRVMVQSAEMRDMALAEYEAQLDGDVEYGSGRGPWPGSCKLHDPLSREIHTQVLAKFASVPPVLQVDAEQADPELVEAAQREEAWLNNRLRAERFEVVWKDCAHNILRDPTAILFVGWKQETRTVTKTLYHDGETYADDGEPLLLEKSQTDPEIEYDETEVVDRAEVVYSGREYRVVDEANFYLWPSDARSITQATATAERMCSTDEEMLRGIEDFGYDAEAVKRIIANGPSYDYDGSEFLLERRERDGVEPTGDDGLYVSFLYYGTLPLLLDSDGNSRLPAALQDVQVCAVICPKAECVLKISRSQYPRKPYFARSIYPIPNKFDGKGLMQLLRELQEEATANLRATIDGINLEMMPAQYATPEWIGKYANRYKWAPGAFIPRSDPREVEPIAWPNNAERGLNIHGLVQSRAQNMVGSENYGKMPSKQRRVIEVQNVMAAVDEKFSFLLSNFHTLLVDIAPYIAELELLFGDPQEMSLTYSGRIVTVTAKDLQQRFLYSTPVTKTDSDPQVRMAMAMEKKKIVAEYLQAEAQLLPAGQFEQLGRIWHACRNALIEIDPNERMPENYIGQEPEAPEMPQADVMGEMGLPGMEMSGMPEMSGIPDTAGPHPLWPALPGLSMAGGMA